MDRLRQVAATTVAVSKPTLHLACWDARRPLPFSAASAGMIIVTDFVSRGLVRRLIDVLKPGGYLVYHTFGAHGKNWMALPYAGELRAEIDYSADVVLYRERPAGPRTVRKVTVKALLQRPS